MKLMPWAIVGLVVTGAVLGGDVATPVPVSTNKDDAPARTKTGAVSASTDADLPPALGPESAKVVVLVFSDFQCPVCRRCADATDQIAEEFPGDVRVEFWQHPLTIHPNAENAAVASLAAHRQGKFWEYHDEVFRNQSVLDPDSLARYAEQVGMDGARFKSDYADPELRARARAEAATAEKFGAKSTPSFMINGKLTSGWGSWYAFRSQVEKELTAARDLEKQGTAPTAVAELRAQAEITDPELFKVYRDQVLRVRPPAKPEQTVEKKKKNKGRQK